MSISPNAAPSVAMPRVGEVDFLSFEHKVYSNGQQHVYGITLNERGKKVHKHISNAAVLRAYGFDDRSGYNPDVLADGSDNPNRVVLVDYTETKEAALVTPEAIIISDEPETQPATVRTAAAIGGAAVGRPGFFGRIKDKVRNGYYDIQDRLVAFGRRNAAKIALGAVGVGILTGGIANIEERDELKFTTSQDAVGPSVNVMLAQTENTDQEKKEKAEQAEKASREAAGNQKVADIGLQPGQYQEITDEKAALPGPIEANRFSMNHGPDAWKNYSRTIEGSKLMGADILSGNGIFSAQDAEVAKAALARTVPQNIIDMLAANDYTLLSVKTITVNSPVYKGMTFNNNGELSIQGLRTGVGNEDVIFIISYKNPTTGAYESVATRGDCGGVGPQVFESVEVPTPPTPAPKPPETPPTPPKPTTTTTAAPTTTTTKPTTTTTAAPTTTTTKPTTTTTIRRPEVTTPASTPIQGPGAGGEKDKDNDGKNNATTSTTAAPTTSTTIYVAPPTTFAPTTSTTRPIPG